MGFIFDLRNWFQDIIDKETKLEDNKRGNGLDDTVTPEEQTGVCMVLVRKESWKRHHKSVGP